MIKINGKSYEYDNIRLSTLLDELGYNKMAIAVECNEIIIRREDYDSYVVADDAKIEIVSFVGGG